MAELMLVNPKKRRKSKRKSVAKRKSPSHRRRNPTAKTPVRRRRRNPIGATGVMVQIQNAAVGAAGALAVDVAMARLPLPANLTATPMMRSASQGLVSLAIGMLVANFGKKRKLGRQLAEGGLTVALHGVGKATIGPAIGLAGIDDGLLGLDDETLLGMGAYENMGAYEDLGWVNAAPVSPGMGNFDEDGFGDNEEFDDF